MNKKTRLINRLFLRQKPTSATSRRVLLAPILAAALACSIPAIHAAGTWDGGSVVDSDFTTAGNWVGDIAPSAPYDGIIMSGNTRLTPTFNADATFTQTVGATPALLFDSTSTVRSLSAGPALLRLMALPILRSYPIRPAASRQLIIILYGIPAPPRSLSREPDRPSRLAVISPLHNLSSWW